MQIPPNTSQYQTPSLPSRSPSPTNKPLPSTTTPFSKPRKPNRQIQLTSLDQNQTLIAQAFRLQSTLQISKSTQYLLHAGQNLIFMMNKLQMSSDFQTKAIPIMKYQRQLLPQTMVDQFWRENEGLMCRNNQLNTYWMLLNKELGGKGEQTQWNQKDEIMLDQMCQKGEKINAIVSKLGHKNPREVAGRVYRWKPKMEIEEEIVEREGEGDGENKKQLSTLE